MSLRARILALGVGSGAAVLVLLAIPVSITVSQGAEDEAERNAATVAQGVADYISTGSAVRADLAAVVDRSNGRGDDTPVTVALADGTTVGSTQPACTLDSATRGTADGGDDRGGRGRDGGRGRGDVGDLRPTSVAVMQEVEGGSLVSISASDSSGSATVCALARDSVVRQDAVSQLLGLGAAGLGVLVAVAVVSVLLARRLAGHLTLTAATADRLSEGDLDARVPDAGPTEVRRVGVALNRLAGRIDELLVLERETVADLSHRLRTPMMAVRLDVEALPASAAKDELDDHVAQLERTLTAVIQAARRPQREGAAPHCDAGAAIRERFDYWAPLMEDQGRDPSLVLDLKGEPVQVRCAREDLAAALDALLENAVAHTAEGTSVTVVAASLDGGGVRLEVRDRGSGVPESALRRGQSDRGSTGLGLDIARACAESSGGGLELGRDGGWSVVRLVLGPA